MSNGATMSRSWAMNSLITTFGEVKAHKYRKSKSLDYRWDAALEQLGMNLEDVGTVRINCKYDDLKTLINFGCVTDVFNIAMLLKGGWKLDLYFKTQYECDIIFDFYGSLNTTLILYNDFDINIDPNMFEAKHLTSVKCMVENKPIYLKVYCPIKYEERNVFKDNWFKKLKDD